MITTFDPSDASNPTAATLLAQPIADALPGWAFYHGTLKQLNEALDALPAQGRAVCLNDLIPVGLVPLRTGASTVRLTPSLLFCIKSNDDDSPAQRDGYTREALAAARALLYKLHTGPYGITVTDAAEGSTFLNLFDAELDGAEFAYRLQLAGDGFDYCALAVPTL